MPSLSFFSGFQGHTPLPACIERTYISTPAGQLELLVAEPANPNGQRKAPIFFAHGGCGGASVWIEWMEYFSQRHNVPCYALSYRGHGSSWYPGYLRMFFTTKRTFSNDLVAGIKAVEKKELAATGKDVKVVLVGHSSGGGISQIILDSKDVTVSGLALVCAIPLFGNYETNLNWLRMDPWFTFRMFFRHLGHPMSPLSSTFLVKQAFFCPEYPTSKVVEFEKRMPRYESFLWPMGMMKRIATASNVLQSIYGWGSNNSSERIAVIAAQFDRLVDPSLARRTAGEYRAAYIQAVASGELEAKSTEVEIDEKGGSRGSGVRYYEVKGAGHHVQNDLQWEQGASSLLDFYEQL